jgi:hypothetical protein
MSDDFLEQLAQLEISAPPAEFDRQLHQRMNRTLIVQHLVDLLFHGMPWAVLHFGRALAGLIALSITGRFDDERGGQEKNHKTM